MMTYLAALSSCKMASQDPRLRNLKIKTGVVKRLTKEKAMYEKEVEDEQRKIDKMKAQGVDEYNIKKQYEVLEESKNMVPDCQRRLVAASAELTAMMETVNDLAGSEQYKAAEEAINNAS